MAEAEDALQLIYTDGNGFTLWQDGELKASVALDGDIEKAGARLAAPPSLLGLFADFLAWKPDPPRSAKQLAGIAARLCRLLREEVAEELERNNPGLASLSSEWRNLLFACQVESLAHVGTGRARAMM